MRPRSGSTCHPHLDPCLLCNLPACHPTPPALQREVFTNKVSCCNLLSNLGVWSGLYTRAQVSKWRLLILSVIVYTQVCLSDV
jgi:hypothetical protein